jgi:hypothetical protein
MLVNTHREGYLYDPRVVIAFAAAACLGATTFSFAADALTSNIPPFSIEQGPRVGFVRDIGYTRARNN